MAQRRKTKPQTRQRLSDDELRERGFMPFLRPEHVAEGETLRLTGFNSLRDGGTEREQIACEVENENGNQFTLGVRNGSPDHRKLFRALGRDWRAWAGSVTVTIQAGRHGDVKFVNVASAERQDPIWQFDSSNEPPPHDDDDAA